jgi:hypothetical protein
MKQQLGSPRARQILLVVMLISLLGTVLILSSCSGGPGYSSPSTTPDTTPSAPAGY